MNRIPGTIFAGLLVASFLMGTVRLSSAPVPAGNRQAQGKKRTPLKKVQQIPPARHRPLGKPIRGIAIHFCSCTAPCGCMFNTKDMEGCDLVAVYHYTDGGYIGSHVNGQTIVVAYRPKRLRDDKEKQNDLKNLQGQPADLVVYLPPNLPEKVDRALRFILVEHNMNAAGGRWLIRHAPITFRATGDGYDVTIPKVLHARTQTMQGKDKKQLEVRNVNFVESDRWLLGKTVVHDYTDPQEEAWKWSLPKGSNGAWTPFVWPELDHGE